MPGVPLHSPCSSDVGAKCYGGGGGAVICMGDECTALKVPAFYLFYNYLLFF